MIVNDILAKVRYTLGDNSEDRWSDARLISLLNDCLVQLSVDCSLFNDDVYLELNENISIYDISNLTLDIKRIEYKNHELVMCTRQYMVETYGNNWDSFKGSRPTNIIYDYQKQGEFVIYPVPDDTYDNSLNISANSPYGIISSITYDPNRFIINFVNSENIISNEINKYIRIFYNKQPNKVTSVNDELDSTINDAVSNIIQYYVIGHALADNSDSSSQSKSALNINNYKMALNDLEKADMDGGFDIVRSIPLNTTGLDRHTNRSKAYGNDYGRGYGYGYDYRSYRR